MKSILTAILILFLGLFFPKTNCAQDERFCRIGDNPGVFYGSKQLWNPEYFQGFKKTKNYFEGWYFKVVSASGNHRYAFIPGISLGADPHSFVQVIDGKTGETQYHRFAIEEFYYSSKRFAVWVGPNFFSADSFYVELGKGDNPIIGKAIISNRIEYPVKLFSLGIMGWYRFVPFMECFHGVVSLNHDLEGKFFIDNEVISFDGGKGYIEKDWGKSMPSAWIWTQSNTFNDESNTSFMLSVANIPWLGKSFTGFLGFLYANGNIYKFGTYTGAKVIKLNWNDDNIEITIEAKDFTIEFIGLKGKRGELLAPVSGDMSRTIHESIDAVIRVILKDKNGKTLYDGSAINAGLELVGDPEKLKP
ncbi:MAG: tocopherol cyclase family protein [Bacteroidales bacterium]|nr:tocopherol cyclase family protein [Bacteroidales bacterium]